MRYYGRFEVCFKENNLFYSAEELGKLGITAGRNVFISRKTSFYLSEPLIMGDNVRIDDFVVITGSVNIGNYVHISTGASIFGGAGVEIGNFCGLSPGAKIFSTSDDFSGDFLISPLAPLKYCNVKREKVLLQDFVQIGTQSVVLPGVTLEEGVAIGALSLVKESLNGWKIYAGSPVKMLKDRSKQMKQLSCNLRKEK